MTRLPIDPNEIGFDQWVSGSFNKYITHRTSYIRHFDKRFTVPNMNNQQQMSCMEVWGGSQLTERGVEFSGLDAWVYSKPYGQSQRGGDVYYASSCATGRITRFLIADVAGHGGSVAATAADLRLL